MRKKGFKKEKRDKKFKKDKKKHKHKLKKRSKNNENTTVKTYPKRNLNKNKLENSPS
jgi:hypothetical protein